MRKMRAGREKITAEARRAGGAGSLLLTHAKAYDYSDLSPKKGCAAFFNLDMRFK